MMAPTLMFIWFMEKKNNMKKLLLILCVLPLFVSGQHHMMHTLATESAVPVDLLTGLLSVWEFDETSGTVAYDGTSSDRDLTIVGATVNQTGKQGKCILLDGVNDYAYWNVASDALNTDNFTISAWIYRTGNSTGGGATAGGIMTKYYSGTGYRCYGTAVMNSNDATYPNGFQFYYYNTSNGITSVIWLPGSDIWTNDWVHVVFTKNSTTIALYVDGEYKDGATGTIAAVKKMTATVRDMIGGWSRSSTTPDCFFKGYIDQPAKWNYALSQEQIDGLFNDGNGLAFSAWQ